MTKNEMKNLLRSKNIPFRAKATLAELSDLYSANFTATEVALFDHDAFAQSQRTANEEFTSDDQQVGFNPPMTPADILDNVIADIHEEKLALAVEPVDEDDSFEAMLANFDPNGGDAECPHCEIHLSNGLLHVDDEVANGGGATYRDQQDPAFEAGAYTCMGCGGHFGEPVVYTPAPVPGTGLRIEKDREERNGIKRPSIGGKCRAVWDAMDDLAGAQGSPPTAKQVKALAEEKGWNPNNASIEYYQWRKFNGITGRTPKAQ